LEGNLSGGRRQGEDDVEIRHGKEFGLPFGEPLRACRALALRAMPITTGVRLAVWRAIARVPSPGTSGNADYDRSYGESGEVVKWSTVVR
jgi:hypothetical protein